MNHSISAIQDNEQPMNRSGVSFEQTGKYDGSPSCWRNAYALLFLPLIVVFLTLGGIIMFTQPLLSVIHRKIALKNFSEHLKPPSEKV